MKKILLFIIALFLLLPTVNATEYYNYGVTAHEQELIEEENSSKRNVFEDLKYRFVEKDTHDVYDYTLLSIVIFLMIIIIVFLNKKTYVTFSEQSVFEKEAK